MPSTPPAEVLLHDATPEQAQAWREALAEEGLAAAAGSDGASTARAMLLWANAGVNAALPRLRELRGRWPTQVLVVLASAVRPVDEVLALEMGADAVFRMDGSALVLAAQLRAMWRRHGQPGGVGTSAANDTNGATTGAAARVLRFGQLTINRDRRLVTMNTQPVPLTEGEFEVLWLLASHGGEPLSRAELLQALRGGAANSAADFEGDRSIDSRVYRLRGKLGDRSRAAPGIRTVRHRGYLFAPAAW